MMIDEYQAKSKGERLQEDKEIKVKIPLDYHIRLHTVKVVKGQNISDTVKAALAHYFQGLQEERVLPETPPAQATPVVARPPGLE